MKKKEKIKVSQKDVKLLMALLAIAMITFSWMFCYKPNQTKALALTQENLNLKNELDRLSAMEADREVRLANKEDLEKEISNTVFYFPAAVTTEKIIYILDQIEKNYKFKILSENFIGMEQFYPDASQVPVPTEEEVSPEDVTGDSAAADSQQPVETDSAVVLTDPPSGYLSSADISFLTTYQDLKKVIDFINGYSERISIQNINFSYDASTGQLSGTMSLNFYALVFKSDEENGRLYNPPFSGNTRTGVDNIFGTSKIKE